ncbi:hypothetical protein [Brochothrix campestris]|uniref:Uncharacterized protein n=1 Tax=Brochothrix campestris FSL F6-1037 TaxID=1265861 RepID=W7CV53_9LIST|nr:hypothetical protein [Brochothrix campestris]EUJ40565.1 hypothetical protein BCAMP_05004 [Brochothrix campestris FSL F6-1037]
MKVLKRMLKSTINLKKRTLILGLLFLVVLTFLISGSAVQQSLKEVLNTNRDKVNAIVSININLDTIMQEMMSADSGKSKKKRLMQKWSKK